MKIIKGHFGMRRRPNVRSRTAATGSVSHAAEKEEKVESICLGPLNGQPQSYEKMARKQFANAFARTI